MALLPSLRPSAHRSFASDASHAVRTLGRMFLMPLTITAAAVVSTPVHADEAVTRALNGLDSDVNSVNRTAVERSLEDVNRLTHDLQKTLLVAVSTQVFELLVHSVVRDTLTSDFDAGEARLHTRLTLPAVERERNIKAVCVIQTHECSDDALRPQGLQT